MKDYSAEIDVNEKFYLIWDNLKLTNKNAKDNNSKPLGIVLGGAAGSGKSTIAEQIKTENNNFLFINPDDLRKYHKNFKELHDIYGENATQHTSEFAWKMTEALFNKALSEKYNVILETSFRNVDIPIMALKAMKNRGYETTVKLCVISKEEGRKNTIERAKKMELTGKPPRHVPEHIFNEMVQNLPDNAEKVFNSGLADRFTIQNRESLLFDSKASKANQSIKKIVSNELNKNSIKQQFKSVLTQVNKEKTELKNPVQSKTSKLKI